MVITRSERIVILSTIRRKAEAQNSLERLAIDGDSPVCEKAIKVKSSRAGHVKPCLNMGGPSSKVKYSLPTDSEPVP